MKGSFETNSVEETWALAREFAKDLHPGDVVCLEGDLGAGKTTFTQGLASAMGVKGRVTSPTFCTVQEHDGRVQQAASSDQAQKGRESPVFLVHMDLYRLHGEDDVLSIGWEDYLARGAVLVVEWPERAGALIPANARHVEIRHVSDEFRIIRIDMGSDSVV